MNDVSLDLHRRGLAAADTLGDADLVAMSHNYLASAHARGGDLTSAAAHLAVLVGHPTWGVRARTNLAYVYLNVGRFTEALPQLMNGPSSPATTAGTSASSGPRLLPGCSAPSDGSPSRRWSRSASSGTGGAPA